MKYNISRNISLSPEIPQCLRPKLDAFFWLGDDTLDIKGKKEYDRNIFNNLINNIDRDKLNI